MGKAVRQLIRPRNQRNRVKVESNLLKPAVKVKRSTTMKRMIIIKITL
jgi:hypothetical protein